MATSVSCALIPGRYFLGDVVTAAPLETDALAHGVTGVHETDEGVIYAFDKCAMSNIDMFTDNDGYAYSLTTGYMGIIPCELCSFENISSPTQSLLDGKGRIVESMSPIIFTARLGLFKVLTSQKTITIDTRSQDVQTLDSSSRKSSANSLYDEDYDDEMDYD